MNKLKQELKNKTVSIRRLGDKRTEVMPLEKFIHNLKNEARSPDR